MTMWPLWLTDTLAIVGFLCLVVSLLIVLWAWVECRRDARLDREWREFRPGRGTDR